MMATREEMFPPRDFEEDLKNSESPEVYALVMPAIRHWWPEVTAWGRELEMKAQRKGRDITLENAPRLQVKSRWTDFDDFLIEYKHVFHDGRVRPGWIEEYSPDELDVILYVQIPLRKVSRVELASLKEAWAVHKNEWMNGFSSPNPDYDTHFCCIGWNVLAAAGVEVEHLEIPAPN